MAFPVCPEADAEFICPVCGNTVVRTHQTRSVKNLRRNSLDRYNWPTCSGNPYKTTPRHETKWMRVVVKGLQVDQNEFE